MPLSDSSEVVPTERLEEHNHACSFCAPGGSEQSTFFFSHSQAISRSRLLKYTAAEAIARQAPEVFTTRQYTAKADVYAYGITVWEIFHNAEIPYPGIENKIIRQKIFDPEFRPAIDESVPTTWRILMKACWKGDPEKRPPMLGIVGYLRRDKTKRY
ncbi:hypothetical protein ANCDUO_10473 [Ancylostoma duodenale]|uniref:Protein kinase domain-containing protein n=1 Tax=Ancylostoma duodenale TaxID=51022 RepID=A0A0C2GKA6_9BILA|nr:hypothetical protein ANCDUO_10473 [Ancylostoma duodenale]